MKQHSKFLSKIPVDSVCDPNHVDRDKQINCDEAVLRATAGISAERLNLETGCDLWGYYDRTGNPVILMATGPGPKAVFEHSHFAHSPCSPEKQGKNMGLPKTGFKTGLYFRHPEKTRSSS